GEWGEPVTEAVQPFGGRLQCLRVTVDADQVHTGEAGQRGLGVPAEAEGCVDEDRTGTAQRRSQQIQAPLQKHRLVLRWWIHRCHGLPGAGEGADRWREVEQVRWREVEGGWAAARPGLSPPALAPGKCVRDCGQRPGRAEAIRNRVTPPR